MADERKYSSLYSAIQNIERRPKRASRSSWSTAQDSPTQQESSPARHESFLRVPSVLEPEDEAILQNAPGLQTIDGGLGTSQMEAEMSPRASSLLRIPPVMDNKPESYANANRGSRASSSFANSEMFGPQVDSQEIPAASNTGRFDEGEYMRHRSLQRAESMGLLQPNLESSDVQAWRASGQAPRFSSPGSRQSSRKFSQAPKPSSVSFGGEDVANQGPRTSYMPLDPARATLPGFEMESLQEPVVSPSNRFSQVARSSSFPHSTDIDDETIQAHRTSVLPLDHMRASLSESALRTPGMQSMQEQVVSPSQKFTQASRSSSSPPRDSGNHAIQSSRVSYMPSDSMRTSLPESFQYAPEIESVPEQVVSPSYKSSQVSRPSSFPPPFDSGSEKTGDPRISYMLLDPMQTSVPESFQYAPGIDSVQEEVVSPKKKFSQVSRASFFPPPFDRGNEANQGPRMSTYPMRASLRESFQNAPEMENMQEQVVTPSHKFSQVSRPSAIPAPFDSGNEGPRMSSYPMQTSLPESFQYAPGRESMQEQVVSPNQRFSQVSRPSSFPPLDSANETMQGPITSSWPSNVVRTSVPDSFQSEQHEQMVSPSQEYSLISPSLGSGHEVIEGSRISYMPADSTSTFLPESYQDVLSTEGDKKVASLSRKFSRVSRQSFAPTIGREDEVYQGPRASYIPLDPMQASLRDSTPGMESMQDQVASPSGQFSKVTRPSTIFSSPCRGHGV